LIIEQLNEQVPARVPGGLAVEARVQPIRLTAEPVEVEDGGVQLFLDEFVHHLRAGPLQPLADGRDV
jgi:hypothetical protein